ncbi:hypothetical protein [Saccharopolyspora soli]|uniref:hypothetical protein n=1 Tax=Saccharopolyspora soli TaxID=2926618 RepID=UPI001F575D05|nr:hypothetical protein [Saccharopolyspora soli]
MRKHNLEPAECLLRWLVGRNFQNDTATLCPRSPKPEPVTDRKAELAAADACDILVVHPDVARRFLRLER